MIDIRSEQLPPPQAVLGWDREKFSTTLRHIPGHSNYNPGFRQLIHVGYKVASEYGTVSTDALVRNRDVITQCVSENLYDRHIRRLFVLD